ncbi:MAG: gamma-glutamylcyclotransferase family protein [Candidatus Omnitrophota bacterium]
MEEYFYFAYGIHMDPRELAKLSIRVRSYTPCVLDGYRLAFNVLFDELFRFERCGLANIVPDAGCRVEGALYRINEEELAKLDEEAGVSSLKYYRKQVRVNCGGETVLALTYAAWPDVTAQGLLPSGDYLKRVISAVRRNKVSRDFRVWLESHPTVR